MDTFVVQLSNKVWLAAGSGRTPKTTSAVSARVFKSEPEAESALQAARDLEPFDKGAVVQVHGMPGY